MNEIRVLAHGLGQMETVGVCIDRPSGLTCFTLVRFHSPMEVLTEQGMVTAKAGNCLLLAPNYPHFYQATCGEWSNDWMYFTGDGAQFYTERYGVPLNTLMAPHRTNFLPLAFDEIANEERFQVEGWEDAVELLMFQLLFKLGRELKQNADLLTPAEVGHLTALRALRQQLHNDLARAWTINGMAKSVGLSASRFATLYQKFFGVSPVEDLIRCRIRYAQYLLSNRSSLVCDVAEQCGYRNVNYFSTIFQRRVGCSPSHYQRHIPNLYRNAEDSALDPDRSNSG